MKAATEACPNPAGVTNEQSLLDAITGDGAFASSSPTLEGREETLSQAGRPMPTDADWAVISAIRHELWQASQGRGYGEDRTLVGMVRRVIAERDEARQNRKGEYELRSTAEQEVVTLRASLTEAQAEIERLKAEANRYENAQCISCASHLDGAQ